MPGPFVETDQGVYCGNHIGAATNANTLILSIRPTVSPDFRWATHSLAYIEAYSQTYMCRLSFSLEGLVPHQWQRRKLSAQPGDAVSVGITIWGDPRGTTAA